MRSLEVRIYITINFESKTTLLKNVGIKLSRCSFYVASAEWTNDDPLYSNTHHVYMEND